MAYYGKIHNKSSVTTGIDYTKLQGEGSARSNERNIAIEISRGLSETVERANKIAYESHKRFMEGE